MKKKVRNVHLNLILIIMKLKYLEICLLKKEVNYGLKKNKKNQKEKDK